jgi:hypothetical protein
MTTIETLDSVPPRAFISYSWSSPSHETWVLGLATRLREDGVEAILDKWDLKPGHDSIQFMEQMVTDPTVSKVLIVCDRTYSEKANGRAGGVGTESQIISPELYGKGAQDKFAALTTENDEHDKAYVPVFYKGRIYFDFSADTNYERSYDELLRWIFNKPLHVKPPVGRLPDYLTGQTRPTLPGASALKRAEEALKAGSTASTGMLREFAEQFSENLESFRLTPSDERPFDEDVISSLSELRLVADQLYSALTAFARYTPPGASLSWYFRLLEQVNRKSFRPADVNSWKSDQFDNFRFLAHEVFVGSFAILLSEERFDLGEAMLAHRYLYQGDSDSGPVAHSYAGFSHELPSLQVRKQRLNLNRISLHADILSERYASHSPSFMSFMQSEFVLYLRSAILSKGNYADVWWPQSLIFAGRQYHSFEIFARAESATYFDKIKGLLSVSSVERLNEAVSVLQNDKYIIPKYDYSRLNIARLCNLPLLASQP